MAHKFKKGRSVRTRMNVRREHYSIMGLFLALLVFIAACGAEEETAATPAPAAAPASAVRTGSAPTPPPIVTPARPSPTSPAAAPAPAAPSLKRYSAAPPMAIDPNKKYTATVQLAKGGEFTIELYVKEAPNTVNSFVFLARDGFYDGVTFHRVIPGFMAQGGDPTGTGTGGPGYSFESELSPIRRHDGPGVLSMANSGGTNTNGSQFFITFGAKPFLDGFESDGSPKPCTQRGVSCHTVFGKIVEGLGVALAITVRDPNTARSPGDAIKTIIIKEE